MVCWYFFPLSFELSCCCCCCCFSTGMRSFLMPCLFCIESKSTRINWKQNQKYNNKIRLNLNDNKLPKFVFVFICEVFISSTTTKHTLRVNETQTTTFVNSFEIVENFKIINNNHLWWLPPVRSLCCLFLPAIVCWEPRINNNDLADHFESESDHHIWMMKTVVMVGWVNERWSKTCNNNMNTIICLLFGWSLLDMRFELVCI